MYVCMCMYVCLLSGQVFASFSDGSVGLFDDRVYSDGGRVKYARNHKACTVCMYVCMYVLYVWAACLVKYDRYIGLDNLGPHASGSHGGDHRDCQVGIPYYTLIDTLHNYVCTVCMYVCMFVCIGERYLSGICGQCELTSHLKCTRYFIHRSNHTYIHIYIHTYIHIHNYLLVRTWLP